MRHYLVIEYRHWHGRFGINIGPRTVTRTATTRPLIGRALRHMRTAP